MATPISAKLRYAFNKMHKSTKDPVYSPVLKKGVPYQGVPCTEYVWFEASQVKHKRLSKDNDGRNYVVNEHRYVQPAEGVLKRLTSRHTKTDLSSRLLTKEEAEAKMLEQLRALTASHYEETDRQPFKKLPPPKAPTPKPAHR